MANTKQTLLDALVTAIGGLSEVTTATRDLYKPNAARTAQPYAGIIDRAEVVLVDDDTNVLYLLDVDIILLKSGDAIEEMIDAVKDAMQVGMAATIGAKQIKFNGSEEVALINADDHSQARMVFEIIYTSTKGAA